jgi:hypothetical protein
VLKSAEAARQGQGGASVPRSLASMYHVERAAEWWKILRYGLAVVVSRSRFVRISLRERKAY